MIRETINFAIWMIGASITLSIAILIPHITYIMYTKLKEKLHID